MSECENENIFQGVNEFFQRNPQLNITEYDQNVFKSLFKQFILEDAHIDWNSWKHIGENVQKEAKDLPKFDPKRRDVLKKVAVIKLNGGLGTTMGCNKAKSFIVIRENLSLLDFAIQQHQYLNDKYDANVPLYLMNSFYTDKDTRKILEKKNVSNVFCFEQSKCPRIDKMTLNPVDDNSWGTDVLCPPGHGNIFHALLNTGTLDKLLSEGKEYIFVSNIDNTGATLDLSIAQFMIDHELEYIMECTKKTKNDIKGGTLIEINGQLMHLEMPQVPQKYLDDFCSTRVFKIFNTNNIWVDLKAVKKLMPNIRSEIIVNMKKIRNREIVQLETSIGGCIKNFKKAYCMHVERNRFLPIKRVEDLVLVSSNLFKLTNEFKLELQAPEIPRLNLGSYFKTVEDVEDRIPFIPDLLETTSLDVMGDVYFGKDVVIKGQVTIHNYYYREVYVEDGWHLENEWVIYE